MAWASTFSKRQKDTSGLIITVDEDSDDDERYGNTTETPNGDEEVQSSVCSSACREQVPESSEASVRDRFRSVCCISECEDKAYHSMERNIISLGVFLSVVPANKVFQ